MEALGFHRITIQQLLDAQSLRRFLARLQFQIQMRLSQSHLVSLSTSLVLLLVGTLFVASSSQTHTILQSISTIYNNIFQVYLSEDSLSLYFFNYYQSNIKVYSRASISDQFVLSQNFSAQSFGVAKDKSYLVTADYTNNLVKTYEFDGSSSYTNSLNLTSITGALGAVPSDSGSLIVAAGYNNPSYSIYIYKKGSGGSFTLSQTIVDGTVVIRQGLISKDETKFALTLGTTPTSNCQVKVYSLNNGQFQLQQNIAMTHMFSDLKMTQFSKDNLWLVILDAFNVQVYKLSSADGLYYLHQTLSEANNWVTRAKLNSDSTQLIVSSFDGSIRSYNFNGTHFMFSDNFLSQAITPKYSIDSTSTLGTVVYSDVTQTAYVYGKCSLYLGNCATCSSTTSCLTCVSNAYAVSSDQCVACSSLISHCATCSSATTCLTCQSGYFLNSDSQCQFCNTTMPHCATCSDTSTCLVCQSGFELTPLGICQAKKASNAYILPIILGVLLPISILSIVMVIYFCEKKRRARLEAAKSEVTESNQKEEYIKKVAQCPMCSETTDVVTSCGHQFTKNCIGNYLSQNPACPTCQTSSVSIRPICVQCLKISKSVKMCGKECKETNHTICLIEKLSNNSCEKCVRGTLAVVESSKQLIMVNTEV